MPFDWCCSSVPCQVLVLWRRGVVAVPCWVQVCLSRGSGAVLYKTPLTETSHSQGCAIRNKDRAAGLLSPYVRFYRGQGGYGEHTLFFTKRATWRWRRWKPWPPTPLSRIPIS